MDNYVITIARGFGSGGKSMAIKLSEELQIPCYERQILEMAAEQSGIKESQFIKVDEKLRDTSIIEKIKQYRLNHAVESTDVEFVSDDVLFEAQSNILKELASKETCIIIGKCANHVLKDCPNVISLYVEASREVCLKSVMRKLRVTEDEAHKMIESTDKYRADYYTHYTGGEVWTNPTAYDLTINTGRLNIDESIALIKELIKIKINK